MAAMKRGEVWWVNFDSSLGGEVQKQRPAVIVSNDAANKHLNRLQVVPLTTQVDRIYPSEAPLVLRGKPHKAMAGRLTTVSKTRLSEQLGRVSPKDLQAIEQAIRVQLGLLT